MLSPLRISRSTIVWLLAISLIAVGLTSVTSLALVYSTEFLGSQQYGLPFVWKTHLEKDCNSGGPGPLGLLCGSFSTTTYQWEYYVFDILFYAGIGFAALMSARRLSLFAGIFIPVSAAWITWAIAFFVSGPSQPGIWTNGLPIPWVGLFYDGWTYSWVGFMIDVALFATLEYLLFFIYRGFKMTLHHGPDRSGGLAG